MGRPPVLSQKEKKLFMGLMALLGLLLLVTFVRQPFGRSGLPGKDKPDRPAQQGGATAATKRSSPTTQATNPQQLLALEVDRSGPPQTTGLPLWPEESAIEAVRDGRLDPGRTLPLEGVTVFLDPGHGGQDGGTQYPIHTSQPQLIEKTVTLSVAQKTKAALEAQGATVLMTREDDAWVSLYRRVAWVSQVLLDRFTEELSWAGRSSDLPDLLHPLLEVVIDINSDRADDGGRGLYLGGGVSVEQRLLMDLQRQYPDVLFLSLHCNAFPDDPACRGLQVYYLTTEDVIHYEQGYAIDPALRAHYTFYDDQGRLRLAQTVHDTILDRLPELAFTGHQAVLPGNYAVLRELNITGVLVEMGYVTNQADRRLLTGETSQQLLAQALAEAIVAYYSP